MQHLTYYGSTEYQILNLPIYLPPSYLSTSLLPMEEADTDIPIDALLLVQDSPTARARGRPVGSTASTTRTRRQQEFEDWVSFRFARVEDAYSQRQKQELGSHTQ